MDRLAYGHRIDGQTGGGAERGNDGIEELKRRREGLMGD